MSDADSTQALLISLWQDDNAWESAIAFQALPLYLEAIRRALKERADLLAMDTDALITHPLENLNHFESFRAAARNLLKDLTGQYANYDLQTGEFYRFYLDIIYADTQYYNHYPLHNIAVEDAVSDSSGDLLYSYQYTISNGVLHFALDNCNDPEHNVDALSMGFSSASTGSFYPSCGLPSNADSERLTDSLSWIRGMHRALNRLLYPVTTLSVFTEHLVQCSRRHKYISKTVENGSSYISLNDSSQVIAGDPSMASLWEECPWENEGGSDMFGSAIADSSSYIEADGSTVVTESAERYCFSSMFSNKSRCSCGDLPVTVSLWEKRARKENRHSTFLLEDERHENIWTPLISTVSLQPRQSIPFQSVRTDLPLGNGAWESDHCRVTLTFTYDFELEKNKLKFQQKVI